MDSCSSLLPLSSHNGLKNRVFQDWRNANKLLFHFFLFEQTSFHHHMDIFKHHNTKGQFMSLFARSLKVLGAFHKKPVLPKVYHSRLSILQPVVYDHSGDESFQMPLQKSSHGSRPELRAVARVYYMVFCLIGKCHSDSFLCEAFPQIIKHEFKNVF